MTFSFWPSARGLHGSAVDEIEVVSPMARLQAVPFQNHAPLFRPPATFLLKPAAQNFIPAKYQNTAPNCYSETSGCSRRRTATTSKALNSWFQRFCF